MKLDLDPETNRHQFEKLRAFSARNTVILKPGFYYFVGGCLAIFGLVELLTPEGTFEIHGTDLSQREIGMLILALGLSIIVICRIILNAVTKVAEYSPRKNHVDEWSK